MSEVLTMPTFSIRGSANTAEITDFIRNIEVSRARFIGVEIRDEDNVLHFSVERVPPRPTLVLMGEPAPADTSLAWAGTMQVESTPESVQLYRQKPAMQSKGGNMQAHILSVQEALNVEADGKPGPETWSALQRAIVGSSAPATADVDHTNARSEKVIATLFPEVKPYARALFFKAKANGIAINIISGTRTFAEQDALYAIGRTKPGEIVTKARGGYSNHNFGIAFDVGVFEGKDYIRESPKYAAVGVLGQELGLEWGGSWKSFPDRPHFQLRPDWAIAMSEREMLGEFRRRYPGGIGE
jgi:peptidoglycan LD-endopeptidase CwlK